MEQERIDSLGTTIFKHSNNFQEITDIYLKIMANIIGNALTVTSINAMSKIFFKLWFSAFDIIN